MTTEDQNIDSSANRRKIVGFRKIRVLLSVSLAVTVAAPVFADGDPIRGKIVFNRCGTCHSVTGQNKMGPPLDGVVGRRAGANAGTRYSNALKASGIIWNDESLDRFLQAPRKAVPATTMTIGVTQAQDRYDVIAYLKTLTTAPTDGAQD